MSWNSIGRLFRSRSYYPNVRLFLTYHSPLQPLTTTISPPQDLDVVNVVLFLQVYLPVLELSILRVGTRLPEVNVGINQLLPNIFFPIDSLTVATFALI